jgi:hypothetical protein
MNEKLLPKLSNMQDQAVVYLGKRNTAWRGNQKLLPKLSNMQDQAVVYLGKRNTARRGKQKLLPISVIT